MPRISIVLPSLNGGGAERVMVTLANALAARGYATDLVLAQAAGPYLKDVGAAVRVVDLQAGRMIRALLPLVLYLRREQPTAVLSAMSHTNVVAILAQWLARSPARLVVSERSTIGIASARERNVSARIVLLLVRCLYRRVGGVVAVSKAAAADLCQFARLSPDKVTSIYNPFDLKRIQRLATEQLPHPWFVRGAPPVVLAVGRLTAAKDFSVLIRAFAAVRGRVNARLLILGEGSLRKALTNEAARCGLTANDIEMPGFVANPYAFLARCALFVLSSRWEGLPGALIEALACGAPVVSTDCPSGPREILEDGRWGALVPVGDVDALATAMSVALATPRAEVSDGRVRAQDFAQDRAVDAYLSVLGLPARADGLSAGRGTK